MKRIVGLILVFCLVFSLVAEAMADEPNWVITQQPRYKATKANVTVYCKVKGKGIKYQWIFLNPANTKETCTGEELAEKFPGIKISGANKNKMVISKAPEDLYGWFTYCHLYSDSYEMDTDIIAIGLHGFEPPEQPSQESFQIEEFTVSANGKYLFKLDSMGNIDSSENGVSSLTFTGTGNLAIKSDTPFIGWTINGVPYELDKEMNYIKVFNLSSETSISLKLASETSKSGDEADQATETTESEDEAGQADKEKPEKDEADQADEEKTEEDKAAKAD